jgi:hypothetical protein
MVFFSMHMNVEKLFEGAGSEALQIQAAPFAWQKLSKNEESQPAARHTPHTPQAEHDDIPVQPSLRTVVASVPESMNDDVMAKVELLHTTAVAAAAALDGPF